jgi:hypothetical protein
MILQDDGTSRREQRPVTRDTEIFAPPLRNAKLTWLQQRLLEDSSNILNHCRLFDPFTAATHQCGPRKRCKVDALFCRPGDRSEAGIARRDAMPTHEETTHEL